MFISVLTFIQSLMHSSDFFADGSKAVLLLWIIFLLFMPYVYLCYAVLSVPCGLISPAGKWLTLRALWCVVFSCDCVTFPSCGLVQVWNMIVLIPYLCLPPYFYS